MKRKLYLPILLGTMLMTVCNHLLFAQIQTRSVHVFVDSAFVRNDSSLLLLRDGSNVGLKLQQQGSVIARYLKAFEKENYNEIGFGRIIALNRNAALLYMGKGIGQKQRPILKDDLVKFDYRPATAGAIFTELAARGIIFTDISKKPHYSLPGIIQMPRGIHEDSLIKQMIAELKETVEMIRPSTDSSSSLMKPLPAGRYKGRTVIDIMDNATPQDVREYIYFVLSYPGKYMGYYYKFNETFATWALNEAPSGSWEYMLQWQQLQHTPDQLQKWLRQKSAVLRKEKLTGMFFDEAVSYSKEDKNDSALLMIKAGLNIAQVINDTLGKASLWQAWAQIYQDNEQYAEAIRCTDSTLHYASMATNHAYLFAAYFKKAYCLYKSSNYTQGKKVLADAEKQLYSYAGKMKTNDSLDHWRKRYEYEGWIDYSAGNYEQAMKNMRKAIAVNQQLVSASATENIASDYWYVGRIYKEQGFYDKSLKAYDSAYTMYAQLNSDYSMAYTQNDIGRVYYSMGKYAESKRYHQLAYAAMLRLEKWDNAGYAKSMLASNLEMEDSIAASIDAHNTSIDLRRKANNKDGQAFSWKKLGKLYERVGQKAAALQAYDSAAHFYAAIGDTSQQAQNLLNLGQVYENDKDFRKARLYYERAADVLKRLQSKSGYIDALFKLGSVTWTIDSVASEKYYTACLQESKIVNDRVNQLYSMVNLSALAGRRNDFVTAEKWMQEALPLALATKDPAMEAKCYENIGGLAESRLKVADAFYFYRKASQIYDTLDKPKYLRSQLRLANLMVSSGKADSAAIINKAVIAQAAKSGYSLEQGDALIALAFQYTLQARYTEGLALSDSAERVYALSGNNNSRAAVLGSKALQHMGMGNYEASIRSFALADSIYSIEKNEWDRSIVANNTGVVYTHQGAYQTAITYFSKALQLRPYKSDDESSIRSRANMAECYMYLKRNDSALAILQPLYPIARKEQLSRLSGSMAMTMSRIYIIEQQPDKALPMAQAAYDDASKNGIPDAQAEALMLLGVLNRGSNNTKALQYLQQATALSEKYNMLTIGWEAYYELGENYYAQKDFPNAIAAFKKAADLIDKNSNNIFGGEDARKTYQSSGKKPELYTRLISALTATGATEEAWAFAQKTQQEAVKDLLGSLSADASNADKAAALQKLLDLQQKRSGIDKSIQQLQADAKGNNAAQLKTLQQTREILEKEYLNYVTDLVKTYPDIDGYFSKNVNPEDFKDIKENIPDDVAIVLYLLNGKQLLIFTATNKKIAVKEQLLTADLEPMVDQYIATLSNPAKTASGKPLVLRSTIKKKLTPPANAKPFAEQSDALYQLLIAPIEADIKNYQSLCIIPNGKLSNLPFQCIGKKTDDGNVRYLIEDHGVFYTNKLTVFLKAGRKDKSLASFTGFGNPDKSLNSAGKEVEAIGKMLNTTNIFLQDYATESKAKQSLEQTKYIHFATHGVLNYTDFSSSYLKMANVKDGGEDGELRIDEIKSLSINGCELVTLSACETAVNQELKKGWYISPANAFLVSSVRSVVASLWAVDDEATNILMQAFYQNLQTMDKQEALRKAQATLSATPGFEHPFYWGAFVLYGDWR